MRFPLSALALLLALGLCGSANAIQIKNLAEVQGVRSNPLIGYGLVVGLQGTGDSSASLFANQTLAGFLAKLGIVVDPDEVSVTNVAAVMVTADLPPFARIGETVDVTVSSIGDSSNLQGGTLLATTLLGVDGEVYALAEGAISIGGFSVSSNQGDRVQQNHPTVGRIPHAAIVERELVVPFDDRQEIRLLLHEKDFTTAARIAVSLNERFGEETAHATDAGSVQIKVPERYQKHAVPFLAQVEEIEIEPGRIARVVLNERTGTVVIGADVRISAVAISHGNLSVQISARTNVSQPTPFSDDGDYGRVRERRDRSAGAGVEPGARSGSSHRRAGAYAELAWGQPARPDRNPAGNEGSRRSAG